MPYDYDLFVIGGGSAGVRCARISASHGAKVAIAEERYWGGTCVNVGCVPKKIMVNAAEYSQWIEDANAFGFTVEKKGFDLSVLAAARDAEVARLSGIYDRLLGGAGVERFNARATFVDEHTLDVGGKRVTADKIVIAVGGRPSRLSVPGAELCIVSDDVFKLKSVPKRLVVLGSGYIALEFACMFRSMGSEVHLAYRADLPLRGFDQDVRSSLKEALDALGVVQHAKEHLTRVDRLADDNLKLTLGSGSSLEASVVLMATGRQPNTAGLNLEAAGVKLNKDGACIVNDEHATSVPHIFAVGDVIDRLNLTPMATAVGHALADTLFGKNPRKASYLNVPTAVFTSPPVSTVGMTEEQAAANGPVDIYMTKFTPMRHTISKRAGRKTMMKLVVCQQTRKVLGLHMLGEDAAEIVQGFAVAVVAGLTKEAFDATIGIHPTAAEEFVTLRTRTREAGKKLEANEK